MKLMFAPMCWILVSHVASYINNIRVNIHQLETDFKPLQVVCFSYDSTLSLYLTVGHCANLFVPFFSSDTLAFGLGSLFHPISLIQPCLFLTRPRVLNDDGVGLGVRRTSGIRLSLQ